jgi:hypothetical protein
MKDTGQFLLVLTIIQFWWIAVWGIAYMFVEMVAGDSVIVEFLIYASMLLLTMMILHLNPKMIDKL